MAAAWPAIYGQPTTVDLARNQTYNIKPLAGSKRRGETTDTLQNNLPIYNRPSLPQIQKKESSAHLHHPLRPRLQASRIVPKESLDRHCTSSSDQPVPLPPILSSTPGLSQNPLLTLRHPLYGLPPRLVDNLDSLGNLVYTAPTGGGKSLVADILLLKRVIDNPGVKGILVLPYVALVQEKLKWLRSLADGVTKNIEGLPDGVPNSTWRRPSSMVRVSGFFGGNKSTVDWADCDVAVCTIEKANSLVNTAIEEGKDAEIGVLVLDELHMINDEHRGYLMELLATKLMSLETSVQIVGMSATLANPQLLAQWLKAKFYIANYRPIPIEEHLVYDNAIYPTVNAKGFFRTASQLTATDIVPTQRPQPVRIISKSEHRDLHNPMSNAVVALAVETALTSHGALVFCSSRLGAERMASLISDALPANHADQELSGRRQDLLASLHTLPGGFEATFSRTVPCGVGFHHAGLTVEERTLIAEAYDTGILRVIVATCSLAAGINLPARRVILNGARMGRDLVGPAMLRQMRGRAGRKGKDEVGETYLCCLKADLEAVAALLEAEMPPVESCLTPDKQGVERAILEVIGIRMTSSRSALDHYIHSSLLWQTTDHGAVVEMVDNSIKELLESELIQTAGYQHCLEPTALGVAVVASGLSPEDGIFVHSELRRALESFVMDGDMHIFYLFTPVQTSGLAEISWPTFRNELDSLDESGLRAIRLIGVNPAMVNRLTCSGGGLKEDTPDEIRLARVYRRAYSAFQLRDLCNEIPVHEISLKYSVPRGQIQTLAQTCHGFAAGMVKFCQRMGWGMLAAVLEHMLDRLRAGAKADLLEMAQVPFVKSRMARIFWENGFRSVRALGEANPETLVPVMMQAQARKMKLQGDDAEKFKQKLLGKAEIIVNSANRLWERQQQVHWEEE